MAASGLEVECGAALKEFMQKVQSAAEAHTAAQCEKLLVRERALDAFEKQLKDRERALDERAKALNLTTPEGSGVTAASQVKPEEIKKQVEMLRKNNEELTRLESRRAEEEYGLQHLQEEFKEQDAAAQPSEQTVASTTSSVAPKLHAWRNGLQHLQEELKEQDAAAPPSEQTVASTTSSFAPKASVTEPALNLPSPARAGAHADASGGTTRAVLRMNQFGQRTATTQPLTPTTFSRPLTHTSNTQAPRQVGMIVSPSQRQSWSVQSASQSQPIGQSPRISAARPPLSPPVANAEASATSKAELADANARNALTISERKEKLLAALNKNSNTSSLMDDSAANCSMVSTPGRAPPVSAAGPRRSIHELLKEDEEKLIVGQRVLS